MNTDIDIGLSRYSDWAFTWSVIVLVLALLMLAAELASRRVRRVEERELVSAGAVGLGSADLDRPGVVLQTPATPLSERVGKAGLVPTHLRDGHYSGAARLGNAQGYRYPHDDPDGVVAQQYPPDEVAGTDYYRPTTHGAEREIAGRLEKLRAIIRRKR